jgi:hypothetical protein
MACDFRPMSRCGQPLQGIYHPLDVGYVVSLIGTLLGCIQSHRLPPSFESTGGIHPIAEDGRVCINACLSRRSFATIPAKSLLTLLAALYGICLFYLCLPSVMKTRPDQLLACTVLCAAALIVIRSWLAT